ncbi:MAG: O-antigen ligase family protein [candidate division WOR-3 bacterium]
MPIKEIFDKFTYVIFSNIKLEKSLINKVLISISISNFIILFLGISDFFFPLFWKKYYYVYTNSYNLNLKSRETIAIRNANNYAIELKINSDNYLIPPNYLIFIKLKNGEYNISSDNKFYLHSRGKISNEFIYFKSFWDETNHFIGTFGHKLVASGVFSMFTVLFFCAFLYFQRIYIISFLTSFISLILTFSKSYIPITIFILILIFISKYRNLKIFIITIITFALLSILLLKFNSKFSKSFDLRIKFYEAGIETFSKSPIYGVGYSHISDYLEDYVKKGNIDNYAHTHNIYIDNLAETGILGFFIFLIMLIYFAFKYLKRGYEKNKFISISVGWIIILIMISGFFEKNLDRALIDLILFSLMGLANSEK